MSVKSSELIPAKSSSLQRFAESRDEGAFRQITEDYGGAVFASALRRTGNRELAQEVTQNVFTILARRASTVARHPSLSGWLFTTTRNESSKAMRSHSRHQRKLTALASQQLAHNSSSDEAAWQDALPLLDDSLDRLPKLERDLLLARFSGEMSFRELAQKFGKSEDACKKRIKRTLEKLNRWLTARGAALSITTLTLALSSEFSRALPAPLSAQLSTTALTTSGAASSSTFYSQLFTAMQLTKTSSTAIVVTLLLTSVPLAMQYSRAKTLEKTLHTLQVEHEQWKDAPRSRLSTHDGGNARPPISKFLGDLTSSISAEDFLQQMQKALMAQNTGMMMKLLIGISQLEPGQLQAFRDEVKAVESFPQVKSMALQMLSALGHQGSLLEQLDEQLANELYPRNSVDVLQRWVAEDPQAALAWYRARREEGHLDGKGIDHSPEEILGATLAGELAKDHLPAARKLLEEALPTHRGAFTAEVVKTLVTQRADNYPVARELVIQLPNVDARFDAIKEVNHQLMRAKRYEDAADFFSGFQWEAAEILPESYRETLLQEWTGNNAAAAEAIAQALKLSGSNQAKN